MPFQFGYEDKLPVAQGLQLTASVIGDGHDWWMWQVPTLRTLGFNQVLYPLSYTSDVYLNACRGGQRVTIPCHEGHNLALCH